MEAREGKAAYRILLVDDDPVNTALVKFHLAGCGWHVCAAGDGDEGLRVVKSDPPDLIVLDIRMPRMNGYEFMGELKKIQGPSTVPVIMLTANETMEDVFKVEGVKAYFVKPVNLPHLTAKIKECLHGR